AAGGGPLMTASPAMVVQAAGRIMGTSTCSLLLPEAAASELKPGTTVRVRWEAREVCAGVGAVTGPFAAAGRPAAREAAMAAMAASAPRKRDCKEVKGAGVADELEAPDEVLDAAGDAEEEEEAACVGARSRTGVK